MDILDIVNGGQQLVDAHNEHRQLRLSAERFLELYEQFTGFHVVAASPQAERVLGAAMILNPSLRAGGVGATVIVDVNIASGTLLARAARRLRDAGNTHPIVGVVLHALVELPADLVIPELSEVVIGESEGASRLRFWQTGDRSHSGLELAR